MNKKFFLKMLIVLGAICLAGGRSWADDKTETLKDKAGEAQEKAAEAWDNTVNQVRNALNADRRTYQDYADDQMDAYDGRINELGKALNDLGEPRISEFNADLEDLRRKEEDARKDHGALKAADDKVWTEAREKLNGSMNVVEKSLQGLAPKILSEKRKYEWEVENKIRDMDYAIRQVKVEANRLQGGARAEMEGNAAALEYSKDAVEKELPRVKASQGDSWKAVRGDVDRAVDAFDKAYRDVRSNAAAF